MSKAGILTLPFRNELKQLLLGTKDCPEIRQIIKDKYDKDIHERTLRNWRKGLNDGRYEYSGFQVDGFDNGLKYYNEIQLMIKRKKAQIAKMKKPSARKSSEEAFLFRMLKDMYKLERENPPKAQPKQNKNETPSEMAGLGAEAIKEIGKEIGIDKPPADQPEKPGKAGQAVDSPAPEEQAGPEKSAGGLKDLAIPVPAHEKARQFGVQIQCAACRETLNGNGKEVLPDGTCSECGAVAWPVKDGTVEENIYEGSTFENNDEPIEVSSPVEPEVALESKIRWSGKCSGCGEAFTEIEADTLKCDDEKYRCTECGEIINVPGTPEPIRTRAKKGPCRYCSTEKNGPTVRGVDGQQYCTECGDLKEAAQVSG